MKFHYFKIYSHVNAYTNVKSYRLTVMIVFLKLIYFYLHLTEQVSKYNSNILRNISNITDIFLPSGFRVQFIISEAFYIIFEIDL